MMTHTARFHAHPTTGPRRTVAVISRSPLQSALETVLNATDHDIVSVESLAHAYSHIKRVTPDLVILCLSGDDVDACQVLSMLALDRETSRIPVLTYMTETGIGSSADDADLDDDAFGHPSP